MLQPIGEDNLLLKRVSVGDAERAICAILEKEKPQGDRQRRKARKQLGFVAPFVPRLRWMAWVLRCRRGPREFHVFDFGSVKHNCSLSKVMSFFMDSKTFGFCPFPFGHVFSKLIFKNCFFILSTRTHFLKTSYFLFLKTKKKNSFCWCQANWIQICPTSLESNGLLPLF